MKKIYLSIFAIVLMFSAQAQLSLTQAFNEPIVGDVNTKMAFDSVGVLPLNTGANQTWDFSSLAGDTIVDVTTFTTVASTPNGTNYAGSTLADSDGQGTYNYYKSTGTQYELVGIDDPNLSINLSNTAIAAIWPITMGYSNTDVFSGTATSSQAGSGPATGTITTVASGTGTLILPGGASYANVLQVKALQTVDVSLGGGFFNITVVNTDYTYYHSSQKFPLLTVSYSEISGVFSNSSATIRINSYVAVGLKDLKLDNSFAMFPNPAKENLTIKVQNSSNANCTVDIVNAIGQTVQTNSLGNDSEILNTISISNLTSGMYLVKTTLGDKVSVRKLIKE